MSLLDDAKVACVFLEKRSVPDGSGGFYTSWAEGAKFMASINLSTTIETRVAEKQGLTSIYTVYTGLNAILQYHDVFCRLYDGKIFRVTSDGEDKKAPSGSMINTSVVTAEEWRLPT